MRVAQLLIRRQESYETDAGQLKGIVSLVGDEGEQSLILSPGSISRIFAIIKDDAAEKAKLQAKQTASAMQQAADEPLLLEHSNV